MKIAIIDIGSNSVRLMLWADGTTLYKKVATTRLGEGVAASGKLGGDAIDRTVQVVAQFCKEGAACGAAVYAFATAAVRCAENGQVFCARVKEACGLEVDVVSGREEAQLGVSGALGGADGGIVDIGGASTEICFRKHGQTLFSVSMDIGAVRLYDLCGDDRGKLAAEIGSKLCALKDVKAEGTLYAIGGTAATLASVKLGLKEYDAARMRNVPLTASWVEETAERLLSMSTEARKKIAGMDERRADIIAGAAFLLAAVMKKLCAEEAVFSDSDNLEGYLTERGLA